MKGEGNLENSLAFLIVTAGCQNCCLGGDGFGSDYRCSAPAGAAGFDNVHGFSLKVLTYVIGKNKCYQSSFSGKNWKKGTFYIYPVK